MSLAEYWSAISTVFTSVMTIFGSLFNFLTSNPITLSYVILGVITVVVGLVIALVSTLTGRSNKNNDTI